MKAATAINPDRSNAKGGLLVLDPRLADILGLHDTIVLTQIHYWLRQRKNFKNGHYWVYNTIENWNLQFPFLSRSTLRRVIERLKAKKILISARLNKWASDQTRWYRIDYEVLKGILKDRLLTFDQNDTLRTATMSTSSCDQGEPMTGVHAEQMLPKSTFPKISHATTRQEAHASTPDISGKQPTKDTENCSENVSRKNVHILSHQLEKHTTIPKLVEFWNALIIDRGLPHFLPTTKEFGMLKNMARWLGEVSPSTKPHLFLTYAVDNWDGLRLKTNWADSKRPRLSLHPRIAEMFFVKEEILQIKNSLDDSLRIREETVYTDLSLVPADHPQYQQIATLIKLTGKAALV